MSGILRLDQSTQVFHGGVEMGEVWHNGVQVWSKPLWTPASLSPVAWWSFRDPTAFTVDGSGVFTEISDLSGNGNTLTQSGTVNVVQSDPGVGPAFWGRTNRYAAMSCATAVTYRYVATRMCKTPGSNNRYRVCSAFNIVNTAPYTDLSPAVSKNGATESSVDVLPLDGTETIEYLADEDRPFSTVGGPDSRGAVNVDWTEVILLATEPSATDRQNIRNWLLRP